MPEPKEGQGVDASLTIGRADPPTRVRVASRMVAACVILGFALLLRAPRFGDPLAGLDEQFYLLVGERMWAGAVPYLDIWDRKPAGLFVVYALIRALPVDPVIGYQCVATLALAATGCVAAGIARRAMPGPAAVAAGLAVVFYGTVIGEGFGEAPIFYDLPVALAAWAILRVRDRPRQGWCDSRAAAAMLLCGVALTIKTSAVFEACAFGLMLLLADRTAGWSVPVRLIRAVCYVALGLLPMAVIGAWYWMRGGFDPFWFANFRSIFLRNEGVSAASLVGGLILLSPLVVPALAERRRVPAGDRMMLFAWAGATFVGSVAVGFYTFHYSLPVTVPLAILAAQALRRPVLAWSASAAVALLAVTWVPDGLAAKRADRADLAALVAALPADVATHCLLVYEGPVELYRQSHACLPGRYVFPGHFTSPGERDALERPSATILRETLAKRPAAIVSVPALRQNAPSTENDRIVAATLAAAYRPVASHRVRLYGGRSVEAVVWVRTTRPSG